MKNKKYLAFISAIVILFSTLVIPLTASASEEELTVSTLDGRVNEENLQLPEDTSVVAGGIPLVVEEDGNVAPNMVDSGSNASGDSGASISSHYVIRTKALKEVLDRLDLQKLSIKKDGDKYYPVSRIYYYLIADDSGSYYKAMMAQGNVYVAARDPINKQAAVNRMKAGDDVYSASKSLAKSIAKEAGGGAEPKGAEDHKPHGRIDGNKHYYEHYHTYKNKKQGKAHSFFGDEVKR